MNDFLRLKGSVTLWLDEELIREEEANLVVAVGNVLIATIFATTGTRPSHFGIGTDTTATLSSMTALQAEISSRFAITTARAANIITYTGNYTASGSISISELGIFNASSAGTMLARFVTQTFSMTSGAILGVSWALTVGE